MIAERFAFAALGAGGIALDLTTGHVFRLNGTAAILLEALLAAGSVEEAVKRLRGTWDLDVAALTSSLLELKTQLDSNVGVVDLHPALAGAPGLVIASRRVPDGYVVVHGDRTILAVEDRAERVRATRSLEDLSLPLSLYLKVAAVRALGVRGIITLHASACIVGGELIVFSGKSGAGKTTTARALVATGSRLVAEDVLPIRLTGAGPEAFLDGERRILEWAEKGAAALASGAESWPCAPLDKAAEGPASPLREVHLLDAARRKGHEMKVDPLPPEERLEAALCMMFSGNEDPDGWRQLLANGCALARELTLHRATMPLGEAPLSAWARSYRMNSTS